MTVEEIDKYLAIQLADDIRRRYGIAAFPRNGRVIMSSLDWAAYGPWVWADRRLDALGRGYYLGAVPIDVRPAWMFDPATVAWLRLKAVLIIHLRLRQILNWLTRALTPKGAPHV